MSGFFQYPRIETERDWLTAGSSTNSSPEIRHFGSYLFSTDFKIEKSKYRHRKRRRDDSLYKFSNNFLRKIKIPRYKDAKNDDHVMLSYMNDLLELFCKRFSVG